MRVGALLVLVSFGVAAPAEPPPVPLRDLKPGFARGGPVLRSRTEHAPGIPVSGKLHRGLNCAVPSSVGFDLDAAFVRLRVKVAVPDGGTGAVQFRILGKGQVLAATPPLFAGAPPVALDVRVDNVLLLELVAEGGGGGARAAWIDGELIPVEGRDLGAFRATEAPFDPQDYPVAFRREVNAAIARSTLFLLARQGADGGWASRREAMGTTALVTLALLKAGVKPSEPGIARAFARLRALPYENTYAVSCLLMALEAKYFPGGADDATAYLDRPKLARTLISDEDHDWIRSAAEWLASKQGAGFQGGDSSLHPVWRYPQGGYDLSCTQYALFGLSAAYRCGVPHSEVWLPALRFLLGAQEKEGPQLEVSRYIRDGRYMRRRHERAQARGFGYQLDSRPTGSMTTAGVCALILCQQALYRKSSFPRSRTREAIRDGLAWLEEYYDVEENPFRGGTWWTYYLFNLERAGALLGQRYIGTRDWYQEGARALLAREDPGGGWEGSAIETSFALLFLKRATVPALTSPLK